jgi:hypothetical protein
LKNDNVLNIAGRRVTVDDSFKNLTPEQQNATVEEIAQARSVDGPGEAVDKSKAYC